MSDQEIEAKPNVLHPIEARAAQISQDLLRTPKSSWGVYELPCGFVDENGTLHKEVVVKEISGDVEDMLTDPNLPAHRRINELLARCIDRLGPYTERGKLSEAVLDLTVGDRVYLMFAIRMKSLGNDYPFRDKCPSCGHEDMYVVDLSTLETKEVPSPNVRKFDVTLPSGKTASFHPMTGRDEDRLAKINKERTKGLKGAKSVQKESENALSYAILMRLDSLDSKTPSLESVQALGMRDRNFLRDRFEEVEGGVDTENTMTCPKCEEDFSRELDVTQQGFFYPSAMRKSLKTKSSI